jgi:hypothetical protein
MTRVRCSSRRAAASAARTSPAFSAGAEPTAGCFFRAIALFWARSAPLKARVQRIRYGSSLLAEVAKRAAAARLRRTPNSPFDNL